MQECGTALGIQSLKRRMKCQVAPLTYVVPLTVNGGRIATMWGCSYRGEFLGFQEIPFDSKIIEVQIQYSTL